MSVSRNPPRDGEGDRRAKRGGGGGSGSLRRSAVYTARKLRRQMTLPEILLWQRLKGSPDGIAFRKRHPIDPYSADFYCAAEKLIIEVDGEVHNRGDQPNHHAKRDRFLEERGYTIVRVDAATILKNADEAASLIVSLARNPLHHPRLRGDGPPPRPGEE